jgi:hypothetical protein
MSAETKTAPQRRRLKSIAEWINVNLPEMAARIEEGYCNTDTKIAGTRFRRPGKGRRGNRLKVFRRVAGVAQLHKGPIFDHNAAETYRSNDDVERWLHNYRFCCKLGRHHSMFGSGGPCSTCGDPMTKPRRRTRKKVETPNEHDRLHGYAERYFQRSGRTEWPTVRMASKALRMTCDDIENAVSGDPDDRMQLTAYQVEFDFPLGEHFVEVVEEEEPTTPKETEQ